MTLPSVVSDLLILAPSLSRCPVAPVELARSEPARSTKLHRSKARTYYIVYIAHLIRDTFSVSRFVSVSCRFMVSRRVKTACERDDLEMNIRYN